MVKYLIWFIIIVPPTFINSFCFKLKILQTILTKFTKILSQECIAHTKIQWIHVIYWILSNVCQLGLKKPHCRLFEESCGEIEKYIHLFKNKAIPLPNIDMRLRFNWWYIREKNSGDITLILTFATQLPPQLLLLVSSIIHPCTPMLNDHICFKKKIVTFYQARAFQLTKEGRNHGLKPLGCCTLLYESWYLSKFCFPRTWHHMCSVLASLFWFCIESYTELLMEFKETPWPFHIGNRKASCS